MKKVCAHCSADFEIMDGDLAFYDQISPVFHDTKYSIPPPTHCPDCRQRRRLMLCNERHFYAGTCSLCQARILTQYPPHLNRVIYCRECWHSDRWDPCQYGREVDFSRPIFVQLRELQETVPAQNLLAEGTNVNSDYIHYAGFAKNCYLVMHADFNEDCCYGYGFKKNRSCIDGFYNLSCELCYDCVDTHSCYDLKSSQDCVNCSASAFLRDCVGCKSCFLCIGLRNSEYCFENKQFSKEEYQAKMRSVDLNSHEEYLRCRKKLQEMAGTHPFKEFHGHNLENCSGDYLQNCKDTLCSFDCEDVEGGKFLYQVVTGAKNVYDIYQYGLNLQESYECSIAGTDCYHILFCHNAHISCANLLYCWYTHTVKDCFGCAHMHNKQYCILNKQYSKEEYEKLMPNIIEHMKGTGEWGEFFPMNQSPFGYNKTTAQLYFPLIEKEVLAEGLTWDHREPPPPKVAKFIPAAQLPDSTKEIPDDILNWAIECEVTKKPFKITPQELRFYREQNVPIPRRSPDQRHLDRFTQRNPRTFWDRACDKCGKGMKTTYQPSRPAVRGSEEPSGSRGEIVYCEECYRKVVY